MFDSLPESVQKTVIHLLEKDEFTLAKEVYDAWFNSHPAEETTAAANNSSS